MGEENNQIVLIFIVSAAIIVMLALLLIVFLIVYQKRVVTQENRLQKLENEKQQILLKAAIEGQERERQRLAKDLHDGIGSLLSGLSLNLKFQKDKQKDVDSAQANFLAQACEMVDKGIKNVRAVSHNLMPATLESFGLVSAINECVNPIKEANQNFTIEVNIQNDPYRASKEIELGLLRIFQELLQNSIKHSDASIINISLLFHPNRIQLDFADNGIGCNLDEIESKGIGYKNIQSRVQSLEGSINLKNPKQKGFYVSIEIPTGTI